MDVWDTKVLRSAAGAHFRINMNLDVDWELMVGNFVDENSTVLLADSAPDKRTRSVNNQNLAMALIEAEGKADYSSTVEKLEDGSLLHRDPSFSDENLLSIYRQIPLPRCTYQELNLESAKEVVLVIGCEAHGLSSAAHKLAHDFSGNKV